QTSLLHLRMPKKVKDATLTIMLVDGAKPVVAGTYKDDPKSLRLLKPKVELAAKLASEQRQEQTTSATNIYDQFAAEAHEAANVLVAGGPPKALDERIGVLRKILLEMPPAYGNSAKQKTDDASSVITILVTDRRSIESGNSDREKLQGDAAI